MTPEAVLSEVRSLARTHSAFVYVRPGWHAKHIPKLRVICPARSGETLASAETAPVLLDRFKAWIEANAI